MRVAEYACVFVRPPKDRLGAAERLVRSFPDLLGGAVAECDLHRCAASSYLAAVLRGAPAVFADEVVARLAFWSARTGARGLLLSAVSEEERRRLGAELALCETRVRGVPLAALDAGTDRFFRGIGAPPRPPGKNRLLLAVELDGPGSEALSYRPASRGLFVAGVLAPPRGDALALSVRHRSLERPVEGWATVADVRGRAEAAPGRPAGFTLRIEGPAALHELLSARARDADASDGRAAPRLAVKAPVRVQPAAPAPPGAPAADAPAPAPRAHIEYATDQQLAADWIENLSHGGAFIRTASPHPEGTPIALQLDLPDGARLDTRAVVVFSRPDGMGVRFVLGPEQEAVLAAAIARISARQRRVLVVDDDALARRMLGDALAARGFEVLTAATGEEGARVVSEELLTLDLLVTDVRMPGRGGEELIRFIRSAGGEAELAIVAATAGLDAATEEELACAGADAVLDKSLGPELIAQAADAALERKRLVAPPDAA